MARKRIANAIRIKCYLAFLVMVALGGVMASSAVGEQPREPLPLLTLGEIGETLEIGVGRSKAIRTPWTIKRVSVADPDVADVEVLDPDQVIVVGQSIGSTDLIIWSDNAKVWATKLQIEIDLPQLNRDLAELLPASSVEITKSQDVYVVSGVLERAEHVEQLHKFLDASEMKYADLTKLAGLQQVQIQVRVAEVNRVAIRKLAINAFQTGHDFFGASLIGSSTGGALNPVSIGVAEDVRIWSSGTNLPFVFTNGDVTVSPLVTLLAGFPQADLEFFIQALAENQYLRILAEPNLVALSGEEASFLAGGEFPIPIVQGSTAGGGTSITIQYKEFGVRLGFTPTVLGGGKIRLQVAPEVSELSDVGAVEIEGFSIPSVRTRRSETTLELNSGQTFAMAGLLSRSTSGRESRVPVLGDLPVLGPLFRSVSYQTGESELVVLVTATLVEPLSHIAVRPLPGDLHVPPNDWELFVKGSLEGKVRKIVSSDGLRLGILGFDKLKGPGAWASYHTVSD
jgi:pilus assembly protein CpaC